MSRGHACEIFEDGRSWRVFPSEAYSAATDLDPAAAVFAPVHEEGYIICWTLTVDEEVGLRITLSRTDY